MICAVVNCNTSENKNEGVSFHKFPSDPALLEKWRVMFNAHGIRLFHHTQKYICSLHFKNDFMFYINKRYLKKDAVPSEFNFQNDEVNHDQIHNLDQICRTCLKKFANTSSIRHIFLQNDVSINIVDELLFMKLKIEPNDGLPQKICNECIEHLNTFNKFRLKCEQSQENLKKYKLSTSSLSSFAPISSLSSSLLPPPLKVLTSLTPPPLNVLSPLPPPTPLTPINLLTPLVSMPPLTPLQSLSITGKINRKNDQISNEGTKFIKIEKDDEFILNEMQSVKLEANDNYQFKMDEMNQNTEYGIIKNELIINDYNINYNINGELVNDYPSNTTSEKCKKDNALSITPVTNTAVNNTQILTQIADKTIRISDDSVETKRKCGICKKFYNNVNELKDHLKKIHRKKLLYICPICKKTFGCSTIRDKHIKIHNNDKTFPSTNIIGTTDNADINVKNDGNVENVKNDKNAENCKNYENVDNLDNVKNEENFEVKKSTHTEKTITITDSVKKCVNEERKCFICKNSFSNLIEHINKEHFEKILFYCSICKKKFPTATTRDNHMIIHFKEKCITDNAKCVLNQIIDKTTVENNDKIVKNENISTQTHTVDKVVTTTTTSSMITTTTTTTTATDSEKNCVIRQDRKCGICKKIYNNLDDLKDHLKKEHRKTLLYFCSICKKTFECATIRDNHKNIHYTETHRTILKCDICEQILTQEQFLKDHKRCHYDDKRNICGKDLKQNTYFLDSQMYCIPKFKCDVCHKEFSKLNNLHKHMDLHTGMQPYLCDICPEVFIKKSRLKIHLRNKHGRLITTPSKTKTTPKRASFKESYESEKCGKSIRTLQAKLLHMKNHVNEEKLFDCSYCEKKFLTQNLLRFHMRIHPHVKNSNVK